ncbi:MAG: helix-turn-helix domain-containing protein [Pseudonocardiaceae bacterium]
MAKTVPVGQQPAGIGPVEIGHRARVIRGHRGLSLDEVAGLAGIGVDDLTMLERGARRFERRGLIEDLANAIGCPVTHLTGQPYLPVDRASADALAVVPGIRQALCDTTLDDPLEPQARPVAELAHWAQQAKEHLDQDRYARAGHELGTLMTELRVRAAADNADNADIRNPALAALVMTCHVAGAITGMIGYHDLALIAGRRALDAAARLGDPVILGLARFGWARRWIDVGARPQAETANRLALAELEPVADPSAADPGAAELLGMHRLLAATLAARAGRDGDARDHLDRARALAERTGERNTAQLHFGPTNVALWTLSVDTDLGAGPRAYEQAQQLDVETLHSRARTGSYHFDLARALVQDGGARDDEAIRHLDLADQAAPVWLRNHPVARELTEELTQRARRLLSDVDSLLDRFGMTGRRSQRVNREMISSGSALRVPIPGGDVR